MSSRSNDRDRTHFMWCLFFFCDGIRYLLHMFTMGIFQFRFASVCISCSSKGVRRFNPFYVIDFWQCHRGSFLFCSDTSYILLLTLCVITGVGCFSRKCICNYFLFLVFQILCFSFQQCFLLGRCFSLSPCNPF